MAVVRVETGRTAYDVTVDRELLGRAGELLAPWLKADVVPIVTDANVRAALGDKLGASLERAGKRAEWFVLDPGEQAKSWDRLSAVIDWLLGLGVGRGDAVLALGGGVVGDLTGFAAAVLKRGCNFVQLPTTLLAQVDSSVGGKTAINTRAGKNLVGAFHQPVAVLADLDALGTLPPREMRAGYAEVIKYGLLGEADFFAWCEANAAALLAGDGAALEYAVATSVAAKARIVAEDERETTGRRALLNLGHTFGHALEAETGFSDALLHGEAVACGMVLAARYSARRGLIGEADAARVTRAIDSAGLPAEVAALPMQTTGAKLADHMRHDKKAEQDAVPFLLLNAIGEAYLDKAVDLADVAAFLDAELQAH